MTLALLCGNNSLFGGYSGHVGKGGNNAVLTYYMMAGEGLGGWGGMYGGCMDGLLQLQFLCGGGLFGGGKRGHKHK